MTTVSSKPISDSQAITGPGLSSSGVISLALPPIGLQDLARDGLDAVAPGSCAVLSRFRANARCIRYGYHRLADQARRGGTVPPVSDWLLDNYYVIEDVIRKVLGHLPRSFCRSLPVVRRGMRAGVPRVYQLAEAILGRADGVVSEEDLRSALRTYQQVSALSVGE